MNQNLIIRRYEEGDDEKINELLTIVFNGWKGRSYWQWKYKENPAGFHVSHIWLAKDGEKVVSYYAMIPIMIKVNDSIIMGVQSVENATHPDYRRRGLFVTLDRLALTEATNDGIKIIYGFPGRRAYIGHIKVGWRDLGSIPRRYRMLKVRNAVKFKMSQDSSMKSKSYNICDIFRLARKVVRKQEPTSDETYRFRSIRFSLLLLAAAISNPRCLFRPRGAKQIPGLIIKEVDSFDERITSFWRGISQNFPIAIDRNCEYLNWRYKKNPVNKYVVFIAENKGEIEGYMVLKSESNEGIIMDIISRENRVFACLLHKALRYFADEGKAVVECWMPDNAIYTKMLKKFGFGSYQWLARWANHVNFLKGLINPFILYINFPDAKQIEQQLRRLDSWFLAAGDSDWENMSQ